MITATKKPVEIRTAQAKVYCPICTHTVDATVRTDGRRAKVTPGQKCARCSGSIDAGVVMYIPQAA
jgi:transposase-like protein